MNADPKNTDSPDKDCVSLPDGSCVSPKPCMHHPDIVDHPIDCDHTLATVIDTFDRAVDTYQALLNEQEHELALVLNLMLDIACYSLDLPKGLADMLDNMLVDHGMLCLPSHLNAAGECCILNCVNYKQEGSK